MKGDQAFDDLREVSPDELLRQVPERVDDREKAAVVFRVDDEELFEVEVDFAVDFEEALMLDRNSFALLRDDETVPIFPEPLALLILGHLAGKEQLGSADFLPERLFGGRLRGFLFDFEAPLGFLLLHQFR